jgi:hypothetical protein
VDGWGESVKFCVSMLPPDAAVCDLRHSEAILWG